ncbi:voltage-dependent T-type calcium channel subunit alpha-1G isoform X5 [Bradysia coprophila]|uniref:voltage-dependent T-type calcium channel subunit alpha-1G isoform X5 n=1 Tax=Bradysia coprophila TaxID=38358 RepID=UPI00187DD258|nr:voltage-dependent T-type calcium channel subunit alpha-1G isoform X5 [Bradysia coprophila]
MENEINSSVVYCRRPSVNHVRGLENLKNRRISRRQSVGCNSDINASINSNSTVMGGGRNYYQHSNKHRVAGSGESTCSKSTKSTTSSGTSCTGISCSDDGESSTTSGEPNLPYPGFPEIALKYLPQDAWPRSCCLSLITNPWFERVSILVILLNCVTLGMYQPCVDDACVTNRCKILQIFDDIIFAFFSLEMTIKMMAMGMWGKNTYLADSWNRLDFFIVCSGAFEYCLHMENLNLTAIRTIRVLRPLRAINRIPSMRILVMLLLDTLPMLGNVLLLCFFVFFIFGIVGVQLWEGILRQRCVLQLPDHVIPPSVSFYYEFSKEQDYICSRPEDSGMHLCSELPQYRVGAMLCNASAQTFSPNHPTNTSCVNWNQYYTNCTQLGGNPFQGTISFDNIGMAWVAIFLVISLEGWTDIMYYVQDAHSFWDWIYFVLLIVIGSFFMINLCLVVIATQFSETKKREMERMRQERARYTSNSTLASSTNNSEPATCYAEIVKYIAHLWRRNKRRLIKKLRLYKYQRQLRQQEEGLLPDGETLTLSPSRIKCHHPKCPRTSQNSTTNIQDQLITVMVPLNASRSAPPASSNDNHISSPENSDSMDHSKNATKKNGTVQDGKDEKQKTFRLRLPSTNESEQLINPCSSNYLNTCNSPTAARRRSAVMFNEYVILHTPPANHQANDKNICSAEKTTQTGDGNIWQVNLPQQNVNSQTLSNVFADCSDLGLNETMTCQELLAFSVAFSAALPTSQTTLESFYTSLARNDTGQQDKPVQNTANYYEDFSCCYDLYQNAALNDTVDEKRSHSKVYRSCAIMWKVVNKVAGYVRRYVRMLVEYKYFQQGILLAILINTLSMGIEYHNQPDELTAIVETSNIVFSGIFAVEMLLKVIAEGPFKYIANGFNVFDGVIVILSVFELAQQFLGVGEGNSGLSVLRTFRLLRILKLVRFMPNLRRQLFVMLRTMDNVAIFFSLLILFIFIFSILGMNLFGCKFCENVNGETHCDRKNFDSLLWALVTVFQILTQEDWNVVLFNGMEKTSHWAALYFVALMTFGNYVLFNLLVAILVEGFSSERNERREREQRELVKKLREENETINDLIYEEARSCSESTTTSDSYHEIKNKWHSAEDVRKVPKCNIQKQRMLQPTFTNDATLEREGSKRNSDKSIDRFVPNKQLTKTYSIKERRTDGPKLNIKCRNQDPPIITTTAATPQDSPNTTLEPGASFRHWESADLESLGKSDSIPSLLKPPSIIGSYKSLNRIEEQAPKIIQIEAKSILPLQSSIQEDKDAKDNVPDTNDPPSTPTAIPSVQPLIQKKSSFKKFSRTSSKKKKGRTKCESDTEVVLNNGRDQHANTTTSQTLRKNDNLMQTANRIQNDTKDTNRISPQSSFRQTLATRRASAMINNSQLLQHFGQQNALKNHPIANYRRRMSSIEQVFEKTSNINLCNLESNKSSEFIDSKLNLQNLHKSLPSVNEDELNVTSTIPENETKIQKMIREYTEERETYSLYIFAEDNRFRYICTWFVNQKWFDNVILLFIALNCITLAMERPNIPPNCTERYFLATANYVFTAVFTVEMMIKVVAAGMFYGDDAYFNSGWNIMDGSLVSISIIDLLMSLVSDSSPRIFGILRVFRLLRSLRPLRVINRAPGLKLVVQTLLSSLRPIGNIVLICCTFFIIFGILGVQLFKGTFFYCEGVEIKHVKNKTDCLAIPGNVWINRKYNFDDLGKALMSLFVLSSRDGWVNIMYTGLDAVGVDQQPIVNFNEWRLLYFIAFILLVGFFVLNMFVGVVVENFHRCREEQEKEEKIRRAAKRALQMEKKRRRMHEPPYYTGYSPIRLFVHNVVTSKYFDLAIAAVIGFNVITMALEYYMMPIALEYTLKIFNYFFTAVFILEAIMKLIALGFKIYMKEKWNQLDVGIVILSVVGIVLEELETNIIPINPTIIRVMRVMRIARVLKLLKMAKGIRALLDTVMQALPQVGNLGLLFFLLFFIFAALGVELFGRLECSEENPCQGLGEHAHFANFGMAFLTLFRVATGDNWNGIMKDTLRDECDDAADCVKNCCVSTVIAPIFFVIFVLMAQFVLVNVVVAVLMKHLEESHKQMEDEMDMDTELEREFQQEQEFEEEQALCMQLQEEENLFQKRPLAKIQSLPPNFTYSTPIFENKFNAQRRQTMHYFNQTLRQSTDRTHIFDEKNILETVENNINRESERSRKSSKGSGELKKEINLRRAGLSKRLTKEMSLDEDAGRRKSRSEMKRMSCDNLPWKMEKNCGKSKFIELSREDKNKDDSMADMIMRSLDDNKIGQTKETSDGNKDSRDNTGNKLFLSVPKLQPARNRSGSTKQLFKQKAMDDEQEIDENSLLLPSVSKSSKQSDYWDGKELSNMPDRSDGGENTINKSDSSEILRIISERRMLEKRDIVDNSDTFEYNQLMSKKSPHPSSTSIN